MKKLRADQPSTLAYPYSTLPRSGSLIFKSRWKKWLKIYPDDNLSEKSFCAEHPNSCLEEGGSGAAHPVGTTWSLPDTCGQAECVQRQDTLYVTYQSCGYAEVHILVDTSILVLYQRLALPLISAL